MFIFTLTKESREMKTFAFTFLAFFLFHYAAQAQTIKATISGKTKNEINQGIPANITLEQYVDPNFEFRGSTTAEQNGYFTLSLDNITGIKDLENQDILKFQTQKNKLIAPYATKITIQDYNILGQKIQETEQDIQPGTNQLPEIKKTLADGIYIRRIQIEGQQIIQKLNITNGKLTGYTNGQTKTNKKATKRLLKTQDYSPDSLYFNLIASMENYQPDTIKITVPNNNTDINQEGLEIILKKNPVYAQANINGTTTGPEGEPVKTEIKFFEKLFNGNYKLIKTDTTNQNGEFNTKIDSVNITYDENTKELRLELNPLITGYLQKTIQENYTIDENNQINGTTNITLEKQIIDTLKIPISVRNFLHENKPDINLYLENEKGEILVFTSDQNGKTLLEVPETFGTRVKMYFKDLNQPDSMYINFQAIQDSINYGKKNLFNAATKDTINPYTGQPDKEILNYIDVDLNVLKQKVDEKDPLVYKILERYSDASYMDGFNGVFDMTNRDHIGMLLNAQQGTIMKMDASIVDTLFIITSDKVQHDQHATDKDITQYDREIRDEWLNDWQYLINNPLDGWKNMHMKIVYVNDITDNPVIDYLRNKYNLSNFIQVYFADDQSHGNYPHFTNDNVFQYGKVYDRAGATSKWMPTMGSELAGELVLQEELNGQYTFHSATAAEDVSGPGKPWRGTRMTNTGIKLRRLMDEIDQGYKFPWKKYSSRKK